jgi:hypothetical protein
MFFSFSEYNHTDSSKFKYLNFISMNNFVHELLPTAYMSYRNSFTLYMFYRELLPIVYIYMSYSWLIDYCFTSRSRIFHLYGDVTISDEGLQNFDLCSALRAFEHGGNFIVKGGLIFFGLIRSSLHKNPLVRRPRPVNLRLGQWKLKIKKSDWLFVFIKIFMIYFRGPVKIIGSQ